MMSSGITVASGTLDSDPVIEGMTAEYADGCIGYRQTVIDRASSDDDLGPIWVDDSIGALLKALTNNGILDDTIFIFQMDHGMETKVKTISNDLLTCRCIDQLLNFLIILPLLLLLPLCYHICRVPSSRMVTELLNSSITPMQ